MNRLYLGMAVLVLSVAATSCGDPTGDLRGNPDRVIADPSSITLDQGAVQNVVVRVVDEQGNELAEPVTDITVSPAGMATVTIDSSFLAGTDTTGPAQIPDPTKTQLVVTGVDRTAGTITVTAGGKSVNVPIRVLPVATAFDATFSNQAPILAEQVTLTAPAGFAFTDTSVVTFPGAPNPIITSIVPDGSALTFLPAANTVGHATITNVVPAYAPSLSLDFTTVDTIATPIIDSLDAVFSTTTPTSSQPVLMSAPGFKFQPAAAIAVGGIAAIVNSMAADSSSVTFQVPPGTIGAVTVDSVVLPTLPQFPLSLAARDTMVAGPLAALANTNSTANPPNTAGPGLGFSAAIFDVGTFAGNDIAGDCFASCPSQAQYYKLTITEPGDYTVSLNWDDPNTDLDGVLCFDAACSDGGFLGDGVSHPEETAFTALAAGTYYIDVILFDNIGPVPGTVTVTVTHTLPAGP